MPEISEVARIVHFLRKHLAGKTLAKVTAAEDNNVYGKVGTSAAEFQKAMTGKKVIDAGQQGKYFWLIITKGEEDKEWPPKYWKFLLETAEEPKVEAAFVDFRRFARIRLVDCEASEIRKTSPLVENGPDPVIDKDIMTVEWLMEKCRAKKIPIKALLLDQANISGIGNWVGDEIMYNAKMHPEQYSNTLSDEQIKQLHESIRHICQTSCDLLGDSEQFPEDWLFKHRWGKGKKDAPKVLPNGENIIFLTVGGRTSAVVPSVQKKTGPVAKEMDDAESEGGSKKAKPKANGAAAGKKRKAKVEDDEDMTEEVATKTNGAKSTKKKVPKDEVPEEQKSVNGVNGGKKRSRASLKEEEAEATVSKKSKAKASKPLEEATTSGKRRSARAR